MKIKVRKASPDNIESIDILIGMTGKMYVPDKEKLKNESFAMVRPFTIVSNHTAIQVKEAWDNGAEIERIK